MANTAEERLTQSIENLEPSKYEQLLKMAIDRARLTGQIEGATAGWRECIKFLRRLSEDSDVELQELLPLAEDLPPGDPRQGLKWFPRPGDNYSVDAANQGFSGTRFTYRHGPVDRMVIALKDGQVGGLNIIPGGQSGLIDSPWFADQTELWLANEAFVVRFHVPEVVEGAMGRETYLPE